MSEGSVKRRLTTILAADVVGYSHLMGEDEAGTLAALKAHRAELFDLKAAQYNGRTIKLMGDGALMEFPSVEEAVTFAVEVQLAMRERNADIPSKRQIRFRIGINIGDVIVEDDDIYGAGVNLAARLEGLAEPGGICLHRAVRNQVRDKLDLDFEDRGDIEVKNITRPVRVFSVVLDKKAEALATAIEAIPIKTKRRRWSAVAAALFMGLAIVVGILLRPPWTTEHEDAPTERAALTLPDKPSIAVLAFNNLSGDAGQDYFADAVAENISTALSRISGLFVVSYDSADAYKGKPHTDRQIGRELGVRYVLRGSVQKGQDRLRITAKLADTVEHKQVWAASFDEALVDILVVQDKITEQIVTTLGETIWQAAARSLKPKALKDFSAYDFTLKGLEHLHRFTKEDNLKARELFIRSRAIDPDIFTAHIGLGWSWFLEWRFGWDADPDALERAVAEARRAAELEPMNGEVYRLLARVNIQWRNFDQALALSERAVNYSPNNSDVMAAHGLNLNYLGRPKEAIQWGLKAIRLNPVHHPIWFPNVVADGYYLAGQYEDAVRTLDGNSSFWIRDRWLLAAAYVQLNRMDEARKHVAKILEVDPRFSLTKFKNDQPFRNAADLEHYVTALREAGVPE